MKIFTYITLCCFALCSYGQIEISPEEAYLIALEHNPNIKNSELQLKYREELKHTSVNIDPMNISGSYGQMNSKYLDNSFSIEQTFQLPTVYKRQKQVLFEEWKASQISMSIQKWQLKKEINLIFNQLKYLDEKEKLITKISQLYHENALRAKLKLEKGVSNIVEKTSAEHQAQQMLIQVEHLKKDRAFVLKQLNFLINDGKSYTNKQSEYSILQLISYPENNWQKNRNIELINQQIRTEEAKLSVEKAKLLPSFNISYSSSTMFGIGSDDVFYDFSSRFHAVMLSVNIPLFNKAQKTIINSQKINQEIAQNQKTIETINLSTQFEQLLNAYEKLKMQVDYYEKEGLKNAEIITTTANKQLQEGVINYLEWSMLINQAVEIENTYIEQLKELNNTIIELNTITTNN